LARAAIGGFRVQIGQLCPDIRDFLKATKEEPSELTELRRFFVKIRTAQNWKTSLTARSTVAIAASRLQTTAENGELVA
jgi:hypothetical protein